MVPFRGETGDGYDYEKENFGIFYIWESPRIAISNPNVAIMMIVTFEGTCSIYENTFYEIIVLEENMKKIIASRKSLVLH